MPQRKPTVVKRPAAVRDILQHADYLAEHASFAVATRFARAIEQTISKLATMPGMGTLWNAEHPRLSELRFFPVSKFRNHLVFYRPQPEGGVEVVRVLHGAQDIEALFDENDE
jgi:toxin ParE1/3/4